MLKLTHNRDQAIVIGENINIRILSVKGGQVRIGITAPKDISVHREEFYLKIKNRRKQISNIRCYFAMVNNYVCNIFSQILLNKIMSVGVYK